LVFPDQYGRLTGLKVNAEYFLERVEASESGAHFEIKQNPFRFDALGKKIEIPEDVAMPKSLLLTPDLSTLREMSWQKKEALVMADVLHPETKRLLPYAPRHILRQACHGKELQP
jgi:glutamine synthetase